MGCWDCTKSNVDATYHSLVSEAEVRNYLSDVPVSLEASEAVVGLGVVPGVGTLDQAETGHHGHQHGKEALHIRGSCCVEF